MPKESFGNQKISSTPINRSHSVRESLGRIEKNIVSGMVKRFTETKNSDSGQSDHMSPIAENSVRQNSFFNDISQIKGSSSFTSIDSGYDSFRRRSKSFGTRSIRDSIIDSYAKYPNFKFSQLKYFGVDPKEYLSSYNIDLDTINEMLKDTKSITGNRDNRDDDKHEDKEFESVRERCQTFSTKTFGIKRKIQHFTENDARRVQKTRRVSISQTNELNLSLVNSKGASTIENVSQEQPTDAYGLKSSVRESIKAFENQCNVRRTNTKQVHAPDITDLKMRIQESLKAYEVKCQVRMMNEKTAETVDT